MRIRLGIGSWNMRLQMIIGDRNVNEVVDEKFDCKEL